MCPRLLSVGIRVGPEQWGDKHLRGRAQLQLLAHSGRPSRAAGGFHSCQNHPSHPTLPHPSKQEPAGRKVLAYQTWGKKPPRARRDACAHGQCPRQKPPLRAHSPVLYATRSPKRLRSFQNEDFPFLGQH